MQLKKNENIQRKLKLIMDFLKTDIGKDGIIVDDNDYTSLSDIKKVYMNATGINFAGLGPGYANKFIERIPFNHSNEVNYIFNACMRGDEDFKLFVNNQ